MPSEPSTPKQMAAWCDHLNQCRDQLCRTWPHMWTATAEYREYVDELERQLGVKKDA